MNNENKKQRLQDFEGTLRATFEKYELGLAGTGNEQIGFLFRIAEEPFLGKATTSYGSFSDAALPITLRVLRALGWEGNQIASIGRDLKKGTEVDLVFELEEYNGEKRSKVKFVNAAGQIRLASVLNDDQRKAFGREVQAKIDLLVRKAKDDDDDIPF